MNFLKRALKPGNLLVLLVIAALCFLPLHGTAIAQSDDDSLKSDEAEIDLKQIVRRQIDVSAYLTDARLKFDAQSNPLGIFTSADDDTSSASDVLARHELVALGQSGSPSFVSYLEAGDPNADPIILFHGAPLFSYEWHKVIPHLKGMGHIIAFDQIGQGFSSSHSTLSYTFKQQLAYAEALLDALHLGDKRLTLVSTDTGGPLSFAFAARHPEQIKGLAFFETVYGPIPSFDAFPGLPNFIRSDAGRQAVIQDNFMMEIMAHASEAYPPNNVAMTVRPLSRHDLKVYAQPYQEIDRRRVLPQFIRDVPVMGGASDGFGDTNMALWGQFAGYLMSSPVPKLFLYAEPGFINQAPIVDFIKANFNSNNSLTAVDLGEGYHFFALDAPAKVANAIKSWFRTLP